MKKLEVIIKNGKGPARLFTKERIDRPIITNTYMKYRKIFKRIEKIYYSASNNCVIIYTQ